MKKLLVALQAKPYPILVGTRDLASLGTTFCSRIGLPCAYILTNPTVAALHGTSMLASLKKSGIPSRVLVVQDSEKSKSFATAAAVLKDMADFGYGQAFGLIAFGGGVVGDLGGFCASIYKRGIPYMQVPTTLLAQVDSSIGGKTAIDLEQGKNLVGTFYQPAAVFSEISFLQTLSARQLANGLAEVIKYACIHDKGLFSYLTRNCAGILAKDERHLAHIVEQCARIKAGIVAQDEREEKGIRTILNFGHTFGHALETAASFTGICHGEAISLGMIAACRISVKMGILPAARAQDVEGLIKSYGLPQASPLAKKPEALKSLYHDKKFRGTSARLVLLEDIGKPRVVEGVEKALIAQELKNLAVTANSS